MKKVAGIVCLFCVCGWMPTLFASAIFINEIHYDNSGSDVGEAIEVAGPAGFDLGGWSIALYNGSNSSVYATRALGGVIPNLSNGFGVLSFNTPSLQNGSPDGLALIDAVSGVRQFLSYEGEITAVTGIAAGSSSSDIGVFESPSTPLGTSLQLTGLGSRYEDFTWVVGNRASFGSVNSGQLFQGLLSERATVAEPKVLLLVLMGLLVIGLLDSSRGSGGREKASSCMARSRA